MDSRTSALCGIAAGAVTLGTAELLAAVWSGPLASAGTSSPLLAVGSAFVDRTPPWLKDWAIGVFGTADKAALGVGMALVLTVVCAALGVLAARRRDLAQALLVAVAALGVAAVLSRPDSGLLDTVPTVVGGAVGAWLLGRLSDQNRAVQAGPQTPVAQPRPSAVHPVTVEPMPVGAPRRQVLRTQLRGIAQLPVLREAGVQDLVPPGRDPHPIRIKLERGREADRTAELWMQG